MLDRRAQIGRVHPRHISQDFVQIVQRDGDRVNGRGQRWGEGGRDLVDLGEGRMRVQDIEGLEPLLPIAKRAQDRKGRRGADTVVYVLRADHVTPPAVDEREAYPFGDVAIRRQRRLLGNAGLGGGKDRRAVRLIGRDGAFADLRLEPVAEAHRMRIVSVERKKPHRIAGGDDRPSALRGVRRQPRIGGVFGVGQRNPRACLHRESRDEMLHQTRLDQRGCRVQHKLPVLGDARCAQREHPENKYENRFLGAGPHLETPVLRARALSLDVA